jgi:competence protein ComEA
MKKPFVIFSKRLERGTLIWLCFCVLVIFVPRIEAYLIEPELSYEWTYVQERKVKHAFAGRYNTSPLAASRFKPLWRRCAPQTLDASDWQRLGLSSKQASSMLRYRDKYGFHSIEQMRRIRVLPPELLKLISDSLNFDQRIGSNQIKNMKGTIPEGQGIIQEKTIQKLDLNSATIDRLVALPGIGQYSAEKIIAYRTRLGGFIGIEQLYEIKGIKPEIVENAEPYLEITKEVDRLSLNSITYEALKQHPYLTWNQANSIIKMRNQKGGFKEVKELKESVLIDEETYKKLLPYVSL